MKNPCKKCEEPCYYCDFPCKDAINYLNWKVKVNNKIKKKLIKAGYSDLFDFCAMFDVITIIIDEWEKLKNER